MAVSQNLRVGVLASAPRAGMIATRLARRFGPIALFDPVAAPGSHGSDSLALPCQSLDELRSRTDVVITSLADEATLRTTLQGEPGLTRTAGKAAIVLDLSPISSWALTELVTLCARSGIALFGGGLVAKANSDAATWILYVDRGALDVADLHGVLHALGDDVVPIANTGSAKAVAMLTDLLVGVNRAAVREALAIGQSAGIDVATLVRLVLTGSGATAVMAQCREAIATNCAAVAEGEHASDLRRGLERAATAALRADHSLFFGSLAIASLLTPARVERGVSTGMGDAGRGA